MHRTSSMNESQRNGVRSATNFKVCPYLPWFGIKTYFLLLLCVTTTNASANLVISTGQKTLILSVNVPQINSSLLKQVAQVRVNHNLTKVTESPTNTKRVRLFSRVGLFLHVDKHGTISGVLDHYTPGVFFTIESFGRSVLRIRSNSAHTYIAMDKSGTLSSSKDNSDETLFFQRQEENLFISFASVIYYKQDLLDMFIGIKRNGATKLGLETLPGQESVQFLIIDLD